MTTETGCSTRIPGDDLDGDGFIRQMRKYVGPGKGTAIEAPAGPERAADAARARRARATT